MAFLLSYSVQWWFYPRRLTLSLRPTILQCTMMVLPSAADPVPPSHYLTVYNDEFTLGGWVPPSHYLTVYNDGFTLGGWPCPSVPLSYSVQWWFYPRRLTLSLRPTILQCTMMILPSAADPVPPSHYLTVYNDGFTLGGWPCPSVPLSYSVQWWFYPRRLTLSLRPTILQCTMMVLPSAADPVPPSHYLTVYNDGFTLGGWPCPSVPLSYSVQWWFYPRRLTLSLRPTILQCTMMVLPSAADPVPPSHYLTVYNDGFTLGGWPCPSVPLSYSVQWWFYPRRLTLSLRPTILQCTMMVLPSAADPVPPSHYLTVYNDGFTLGGWPCPSVPLSYSVQWWFYPRRLTLSLRPTILQCTMMVLPSAADPVPPSHYLTVYNDGFTLGGWPCPSVPLSYSVQWWFYPRRLSPSVPLSYSVQWWVYPRRLTLSLRPTILQCTMMVLPSAAESLRPTILQCTMMVLPSAADPVPPSHYLTVYNDEFTLGGWVPPSHYLTVYNDGFTLGGWPCPSVPLSYSVQWWVYPRRLTLSLRPTILQCTMMVLPSAADPVPPSHYLTVYNDEFTLGGWVPPSHYLTVYNDGFTLGGWPCPSVPLSYSVQWWVYPRWLSPSVPLSYSVQWWVYPRRLSPSVPLSYSVQWWVYPRWLTLSLRPTILQCTMMSLPSAADPVPPSHYLTVYNDEFTLGGWVPPSHYLTVYNDEFTLGGWVPPSHYLTVYNDGFTLGGWPCPSVPLSYSVQWWFYPRRLTLSLRPTILQCTMMSLPSVADPVPPSHYLTVYNDEFTLGGSAADPTILQCTMMMSLPSAAESLRPTILQCTMMSLPSVTLGGWPCPSVPLSYSTIGGWWFYPRRLTLSLRPTILQCTMMVLPTAADPPSLRPTILQCTMMSLPSASLRPTILQCTMMVLPSASLRPTILQCAPSVRVPPVPPSHYLTVYNDDFTLLSLRPTILQCTMMSLPSAAESFRLSYSVQWWVYYPRRLSPSVPLSYSVQWWVYPRWLTLSLRPTILSHSVPLSYSVQWWVYPRRLTLSPRPTILQCTMMSLPSVAESLRPTILQCTMMSLPSAADPVPPSHYLTVYNDEFTLGGWPCPSVPLSYSVQWWVYPRRLTLSLRPTILQCTMMILPSAADPVPPSHYLTVYNDEFTLGGWPCPSVPLSYSVQWWFYPRRLTLSLRPTILQCTMMSLPSAAESLRPTILQCTMMILPSAADPVPPSHYLTVYNDEFTLGGWVPPSHYLTVCNDEFTLGGWPCPSVPLSYSVQWWVYPRRLSPSVPLSYSVQWWVYPRRLSPPVPLSYSVQWWFYPRRLTLSLRPTILQCTMMSLPSAADPVPPSHYLTVYNDEFTFGGWPCPSVPLSYSVQWWVYPRRLTLSLRPTILQCTMMSLPSAADPVPPSHYLTVYNDGFTLGGWPCPSGPLSYSVQWWVYPRRLTLSLRPTILQCTMMSLPSAADPVPPSHYLTVYNDEFTLGGWVPPSHYLTVYNDEFTLGGWPCPSVPLSYSVQWWVYPRRLTLSLRPTILQCTMMSLPSAADPVPPSHYLTVYNDEFTLGGWPCPSVPLSYSVQWWVYPRRLTLSLRPTILQCTMMSLPSAAESLRPTILQCTMMVLPSAADPVPPFHYLTVYNDEFTLGGWVPPSHYLTVYNDGFTLGGWVPPSHYLTVYNDEFTLGGWPCPSVPLSYSVQWWVYPRRLSPSVPLSYSVQWWVYPRRLTLSLRPTILQCTMMVLPSAADPVPPSHYLTVYNDDFTLGGWPCPSVPLSYSVQWWFYPRRLTLSLRPTILQCTMMVLPSAAESLRPTILQCTMMSLPSAADPVPPSHYLTVYNDEFTLGGWPCPSVPLSYSVQWWFYPRRLTLSLRPTILQCTMMSLPSAADPVPPSHYLTVYNDDFTLGGWPCPSVPLSYSVQWWFYPRRLTLSLRPTILQCTMMSLPSAADPVPPSHYLTVYNDEFTLGGWPCPSVPLSYSVQWWVYPRRLSPSVPLSYSVQWWVYPRRLTLSLRPTILQCTMMSLPSAADPVPPSHYLTVYNDDFTLGGWPCPSVPLSYSVQWWVYPRRLSPSVPLSYSVQWWFYPRRLTLSLRPTILQCTMMSLPSAAESLRPTILQCAMMSLPSAADPVPPSHYLTVYNDEFTLGGWVPPSHYLTVYNDEFTLGGWVPPSHYLTVYNDGFTLGGWPCPSVPLSYSVQWWFYPRRLTLSLRPTILQCTMMSLPSAADPVPPSHYLTVYNDDFTLGGWPCPSVPLSYSVQWWFYPRRLTLSLRPTILQCTMMSLPSAADPVPPSHYLTVYNDDFTLGGWVPPSHYLTVYNDAFTLGGWPCPSVPLSYSVQWWFYPRRLTLSLRPTILQCTMMVLPSAAESLRPTILQCTMMSLPSAADPVPPSHYLTVYNDEFTLGGWPCPSVPLSYSVQWWFYPRRLTLSLRPTILQCTMMSLPSAADPVPPSHYLTVYNDDFTLGGWPCPSVPLSYSVQWWFYPRRLTLSLRPTILQCTMMSLPSAADPVPPSHYLTVYNDEFTLGGWPCPSVPLSYSVQWWVYPRRLSPSVPLSFFF